MSIKTRGSPKDAQPSPSTSASTSKRKADTTSTQTASTSSSRPAILVAAPDAAIRQMKDQLAEELKSTGNRASIMKMFEFLASDNDPTSKTALAKDTEGVKKLRLEWRKLFTLLLSTAIKSGSKHGKSSTTVMHGKFGLSSTGFWYSKHDLNEQFAPYPEFAGKVPELVSGIWNRLEHKKERRATLFEIHKKCSTEKFDYEFDWALKKFGRETIDGEIAAMYNKNGFLIPGSGLGWEHNFARLFEEPDIEPKVEEWGESVTPWFDFAVSPRHLRLQVPGEGQELYEEVKGLVHPFFMNKGLASMKTLNLRDPHDPSGQSFTEALTSHYLQGYTRPASLTYDLTYDQKKAAVRSCRQLYERNEINLNLAKVALHERELASIAGSEYSMNKKKKSNPGLGVPDYKHRDMLLDFASKVVTPIAPLLEKLDTYIKFKPEQFLKDCENASKFCNGKLGSASFAEFDEVDEFENNDDGSRRMVKASPFDIHANNPTYDIGSSKKTLKEGVKEYQARRSPGAARQSMDRTEDYTTSVSNLIPDIEDELKQIFADPYAIQLLTAAHSGLYSTIPSSGYTIRNAIAQLTRTKARFWRHRENLGPTLLPLIAKIVTRSFVLAMLLPTAGFADLVTENSIRLLKASHSNLTQAQQVIIESIRMGCKGMIINAECFNTYGMHYFFRPWEVLENLTTDPRWIDFSSGVQNLECALEEVCARPLIYNIKQTLTEPTEFNSVLVNEARTPLTLYDGLSRQPYFDCPAWIYGHLTFSAGIATALLRLAKTGHKSCKYSYGKVFTLMSTSKEEMRGEQIKAELGGGALTEEMVMDENDDDEGRYYQLKENS